MPGCMLDRWMGCIWATSSSSATVHTASLGSATVWISSSHCRDTLVSWSAWLSWDLTSHTSISSSYSGASSLSVASHGLINISESALVCTLVCPALQLLNLAVTTPLTFARKHLCWPYMCPHAHCSPWRAETSVFSGRMAMRGITPFGGSKLIFRVWKHSAVIYSHF